MGRCGMGSNPAAKKKHPSAAGDHAYTRVSFLNQNLQLMIVIVSENEWPWIMNPNGPNRFRSFDSWPLQLFQQPILACSRQGASGLRYIAKVLRCRLHHVHKNATSAWDEWPWDCHGKKHISIATAYFKWQFWRLLLATKSFRLFGGKCSLERSWHTFLPPADVMLLDVLLLSVWYLAISLLFGAIQVFYIPWQDHLLFYTASVLRYLWCPFPKNIPSCNNKKNIWDILGSDLSNSWGSQLS